jgi:hypothetical protein
VFFIFSSVSTIFLALSQAPPALAMKTGLIQAEQRDRHEVADEEIGLNEGKRERREEDGQEDVEHPLLRVLRADLDDLLAVGDRRLLHAVQLDVRLDELHGTVAPGGDRLRSKRR